MAKSVKNRLNGVLKHLKANLNKGIRKNGECMDFNSAMVAFDIFLLGLLAWFYYYFYTMVSAVLAVNDKLISKIYGTQTAQEDEMQMKLDTWLSEEE